MFSMAYGYEIQPKFRQKKTPMLLNIGGFWLVLAVL
tara:strand:+ start:973 stop:1080 length:108 start_codon:yes stop_codon:yes gene_type:complete